MQFDIHKNLYFLRICGNFNTSKIAFAAEPLVRLKVRGERLKAGIFYRFALNYFVTATLAAYFVHIGSYPYYIITM